MRACTEFDSKSWDGHHTRVGAVKISEVSRIFNKVGMSVGRGLTVNSLAQMANEENDGLRAYCRREGRETFVIYSFPSKNR